MSENSSPSSSSFDPCDCESFSHYRSMQRLLNTVKMFYFILRVVTKRPNWLNIFPIFFKLLIKPLMFLYD